ncbi:hypothetical protein MWU75_18175 [Ornithinimicrobium sp. F0845]|uniref:hypothetical protein n=1 Tax=Ornithinimicrobium sp. F0845 TaxID=2926412 RepID=UPI001FF3238D|nr:hypothetical protein [Ornithinimicrobium sp. F0845]MCK0114073.1 hypothetical protein [Ornithinimicrobium sp. F0845]
MDLDTRRPFRWRDGRRAGLSNNKLNSAAFRKLARGIYISSEVTVDALIEAQAAVLVAGAQGFTSHHTRPACTAQSCRTIRDFAPVFRPVADGQTTLMWRFTGPGGSP